MLCISNICQGYLWKGRKMSILIRAVNIFAEKYSQVDVLAPQMALGLDYDRQTIRKDHFISQSSQIS